MRRARAIRKTAAAVLRRPPSTVLNTVYSALWLLLRALRGAWRALRAIAFWASWPIRWPLARLAPPLRRMRERVGLAPPTPDPALVDRMAEALKSLDPDEINDASLEVLEKFVAPAVHRGMMLTAGRAGRRRLRAMPPDELADAIFGACVAGPPCFPPFPPETHILLSEAIRRYAGAA